MPVEGEYEPSPEQWVHDQVELHESPDGLKGSTFPDIGLPVIILTTRGAKSGKIRKTPPMRVAHGGAFGVVASKGGAPKHPAWYFNVKANPHVRLRDGPSMAARQIIAAEKARWWERAVAAYPPYAEYRRKTDREIPVFVLEPVNSSGN
ncbi:nitroreductase family deazaflavin-dependent oxidoreductase [Streptomyces sp. MC1]|uniref:nitroreductase family deazaflavin-dependent oxidoreductase n=1 Tax=unclassified Streptomyces TaxID=2593676 RepID=UPI0004C8B20A|nr:MULTISPECIES: nitroreductase family deazaflavin-dependent oxidoreductase [unclassified Streptomyces]KOV92101.1 nitroreductase [Streptomyces sp. NRRL WC-3723]MBG7702780.1 nitroreductase family deazaflavin-dependent oxidoreductase [Streptomyces sp. MC1]